MNDGTTILLLLVDDEPLIALQLEDALSEAGFTCILARDGTAAFKEVEADMARFSGVITDVHLGPGPDGWQVAHRARELVPEIPIIYMTGAGSGEWSANGVPNSILVQKPFVPAQIITAITGLLNKSSV